MKTKLKLMVMY